MFVNRTRLLVNNTKKLLRRGADDHIRKIIRKTHAADLARVFLFLSDIEQQAFFDLFETNGQKALFLSELEDETTLRLIENMPSEEIVKIFEKMDKDDVADLLRRIPKERANALLNLLVEESAKAVEMLLGHDPKTAGGIMITDFIALKEDISVKEATGILQKDYAAIEMPLYLYVVNDYGHLIGVISLRKLVVVPPETRLKAIMDTGVISVQTNTVQEEVARLVAHYNILAVPVVDQNNILVGIVTIDDIIDIIQKEATEDILKMAGVSGGVEYIETQTFFKSVRQRLPWLLASWFGGIIACYVVGYYENSLHKLVYLAAFMPIIMGMGGNVGTQTSAGIMRGLATGRIDISQIQHVILRELAIGFCLGFFYGSMLSLFAQFKYGFAPWQLGLVVGFAMICSMTLAATLASSIPLIFHRLDIDPAVASGPFVTTFTDILSVFFYFKIATLFLKI